MATTAPSNAVAIPAEPSRAGATAPKIRGRGPWRLAWERLRRDRVAIGSLVVIGLIVLMALLAPVLAAVTGHSPDEQFRKTGLSPAGLPMPPSHEFWLGTDDLGRDLAVRIAYGARISLLVGFIATALTLTIGVAVGVLAGYLGGLVDTVLARLVDLILSIPFLLVAISLVSVIGPSLKIAIIVISLFSWASVARIVRGQVLSIREREYIEAARSLGASDTRIMIVDVLPNVMAPVIVYASLLIPAVIVIEATLSFLGLGVPPPTATWGGMLNSATNYYTVAWWYILFPGLALLITTLAFNLFGDGIRDAIDPRGEVVRRGRARGA